MKNNFKNIFWWTCQRRRKIYDAFLYGWSNYSKGYGIEIQKAADPEKKLLLSIHEYRHFTHGVSGEYSLLKESIDEEVREDIESLVNILEESEYDTKKITKLGEVLDFKKLFSNEEII